MKKWLKMIKNEKGLTLIELLAVVVILGIIAAIAVPSISGIIDNTKKDAHVSNALMIISSAKLAEASGSWNTTTIQTIKGGDLVDTKYLDALPKDPDGEKYTSVIVTKDINSKPNVYSIKLVGSKRSVNATESELNSEGRKKVSDNK